MADTVTIGGNSYTIYGTKAASLVYWTGMLGPVADRWATTLTGTPANIDKALNMAGVLIDRQAWGDAAATVALRNAIPAFAQASYEMAGLLLIDPGLFTAIMSGKNIKRVSPGGGVEIEFFNPTLGITGRFPIEIQELIGEYLAGAEGGEFAGSWSSGTTSTTGGADSVFGNTINEGAYDLVKGLP